MVNWAIIEEEHTIAIASIEGRKLWKRFCTHKVVEHVAINIHSYYF